MSKKPPLIILAGPTAVGKTELSISLAKAIGGEIISCDSMQVYKYMDIGSAKIRPEEMDGIRHYLVDELLPDEEFHVARFVAMAKEAMAEIYERGHIPIAVGGTGFYIQALLYDTDFSKEDSDGKIRAELEALQRRRVHLPCTIVCDRLILPARMPSIPIISNV
nr:isopentenyl transferase family protein [Roseburia sp. AM51-8]